PGAGPAQTPKLFLGYVAATSVITLTRYGTPDANARSIAGPISRGSVTVSPAPPSALTTSSYAVRGARSAITSYPESICMGPFSSPHAELLPITMTTGRSWRTSVSTSISEKPAAPSPSSSTTWDDGRATRAAMAAPRPAPRQPYGPGSSQPPGRFGS